MKSDYSVYSLKELENIIDNANSVLNKNPSYPSFSKYGSFHTNEMNERNGWARRKRCALDEIKRRNNATTNLHTG
jgi:hypothetical protein